MEFKKRTTAPEAGNKFYTHFDGGGYNICKKIKGNSVENNCVGYTYGRWHEAQGIAKVDWKFPAGDPSTWIEVAKKNNLPVGTTPQVGDAVVWDDHVASVEEVMDNLDILISQEGAPTKERPNGTDFNMVILKAPHYERYGHKDPVFIHPTVKFDVPKITLNEKSYSDYTKDGLYYRVKDAKGKQIGAYKVWANAYKKWAEDKTRHIYDANGAQLDKEQPTEQAQPSVKETLTATSRPDYTGNKVYRVRKSYNDNTSSLGSYQKFANAFKVWSPKKNEGYHIYDAGGNRVD